MTATHIRSDSNLALMAMEVTPEHACYGIDPGGIGDGYLRAESLLKRTEVYVHPDVVQALRDERIRQGVTQPDVAACLGITYQHLCMTETGYRHTPMSIHRAQAYADVLGVDLDTICAPHDLAAD